MKALRTIFSVLVLAIFYIPALAKIPAPSELITADTNAVTGEVIHRLHVENFTEDNSTNEKEHSYIKHHALKLAYRYVDKNKAIRIWSQTGYKDKKTTIYKRERYLFTKIEFYSEYDSIGHIRSYSEYKKKNKLLEYKYDSIGNIVSMDSTLKKRKPISMPQNLDLSIFSNKLTDNEFCVVDTNITVIHYTFWLFGDIVTITGDTKHGFDYFMKKKEKSYPTELMQFTNEGIAKTSLPIQLKKSDKIPYSGPWMKYSRPYFVSEEELASLSLDEDTIRKIVEQEWRHYLKGNKEENITVSKGSTGWYASFTVSWKEKYLRVKPHRYKTTITYLQLFIDGNTGEILDKKAERKVGYPRYHKIKDSKHEERVNRIKMRMTYPSDYEIDVSVKNVGHFYF